MIPSANTNTILVVDPCEALCALIQFTLVNAGYHTLTATNSADAIQLAQSTPKVDLLLCDMEIPDMRGEHLAVEITTLHPSASVVFATDWVSQREATVPFALLPKPFTIPELRAGRGQQACHGAAIRFHAVHGGLRGAAHPAR